LKRSLILKRETLAALDTNELAAVAAGAEWTFPQCQAQLARQIVAMLVSPLPTDPCA
jgi:hypothetical protein